MMRGPGLGDALTRTDPRKTGVPVLPVRALKPDSQKAARHMDQFIQQARKLLGDKHSTNMILLRSFAHIGLKILEISGVAQIAAPVVSTTISHTSI